MYYLHFCSLKKLKTITYLVVLLIVIFVSGVLYHPLEKDFFTDFHYPYDGDIEGLVFKLRHNQTPDIPPINNFNFYYNQSCDTKCRDVTDLRLVYIVKSAPQHFNRRSAIRRSWGFQRRFSDVEIRTVFLIGTSNDVTLLTKINEEYQRFNDIVQANYTDSYYNNTYKTMSGFNWAINYCLNAKFYMFVDDDYYVSTKNVLRFIRHPTKYPDYLKETNAAKSFMMPRKSLQLDINYELDDDVRLYTGYALQSAPHRHYISKWFITLEEYPYHLWPPYVSAGAYILSNSAIKDLYYASFYTKHFRFDDIYIGILAYKTKIEPFHSEEFYFNKKLYNRDSFKYVVASHGYGEPEELIRVWSEQKSLGNA